MEFFQQAQMFALSDLEELSLTRVCMLLTQCFYLLAVCRTDEYAGNTSTWKKNAKLNTDAGPDSVSQFASHMLLDFMSRILDCHLH